MADISATLPAWSTTRSSNAPAGSTSIGTGLDDNLREIQGVVRGWLASQGADIASAGTTDLGAVEGVYHSITGTTTITSFGTIAAGIVKHLKFAGILILTYNATSLILPTSASITTAAGDTATFISEGSGNWRCLQFSRASGAALLAAAGTLGFSTGDVKPTIKTTADAGFVMLNDGTMGDASSGGTTRANADTSALFTLLWNNVSNTYAAVSSGRGASAAADFAAHKTIALPKALGRALGAYGAGSGLTSRALGETAGAETVVADLAAHTHAITDVAHNHSNTATFAATNSLALNDSASAGAVGNSSDGLGSSSTPYTPTGTVTMTNVAANSGITVTNSAGAGGGHANVQPTLFISYMICL